MNHSEGLEAAGMREGDVLAGKYRVEKVLGVGGMGIVIAARHVQLDEKVALKFLLPEALGNPEAAARFLREARNAVKIKSEHVARVSDVGTLANGAPYMVMEYLEGDDLAAWLHQRGPLPIELAAEFMLQACVAVAEAHALGIIHRDLKPGNLFCTRRSDGQLSIKVLDFGISKVIDAARASEPASLSMTRTSAMMGTPLYMSPEQMRSSKDVDAATDIWALGAILYQLVAGKPAFIAESLTELAVKVANEPPASLRALRPDGAGLEPVVFRCLEKERAARYRNVGELAVALAPFVPHRANAYVERILGIIQAAGQSSVAPAARVVSPAPSTLAAPGTFRSVERTTAGLPKGRALLGTGVVAVLALAGVVSAAFLFNRGPGRRNEARAAVPSASSVPVAVTGQRQLRDVPVEPPSPATAPAAVTQNPAAPPAPSPAPAPPPGRPLPGTRATSVQVILPSVPAPSAQPPDVPPPPAASPSTKPNCDPPYVIDSAGHHQYKPECL